MAKISLEELKARSRELGFNPECIELVRAAKSPTAAYELSIARGSYPEFAKKCRYLAMIKRDYGKAAFERIVAELVANAKCNHFIFWAFPFAQTASRLFYLRDWMQKHNKDILVLPAQDEFYIDVVEECIAACGRFDEAAKAHFTELGGAQYLDEAEQFVESAKAGNAIDKYCLEKTGRVVKEMLYASALMYGVPDTFVPNFSSDIAHFVWQLRLQKENEETTASLKGAEK